MTTRNIFALAVSISMSVAACTETTTPIVRDAEAPKIGAPSGPLLTSLTCTASVQQKSVECAIPGAETSDGLRHVIMGGQNQYIKLTTSNIATVADSFTFDLTVQNLIPQPIGTTNGTSAHAAGVRVFFTQGPTSTTGGTISVANEDGTGTFTAPSQPYFQYDGMLEQDSVSPSKRWKLQFTPLVTHFTFSLLVAAEVPYPAGYIDGIPYVITLNPNEAWTLLGSVRTFLGDLAADQSITWSSSAPGTAGVSGTTLTAGSARGWADLTSTAGAASGLWTTAVAVCQAVVVTTGTSLPSSIASTDCLSSYGSNSGKPTDQYYADLFRVSLTAGQTIEVTMDSGDDLDTYLLLAEPGTGFLVAGNDDDDEDILGVGSRVVYTATKTGVYVIEASTFQGSDTGSYTLGVTVN